MLYDTHCHPYLSRYKSQENILENFFNQEGVYLNTISTNLKDSISNIALARKYSGIYTSIGIHPVDVLDYAETIVSSLDILRKLYKENPLFIVAIGECGLDYHWVPKLAEKYHMTQDQIKELQKIAFRFQVDLAKELNLPIIIHNRESGDDIFEILQEKDFKNFVFHCFSEKLDFALKLIAFAPECKIGFGGILTFKNVEYLTEVAKYIPLKNIIIETDSPYLTPLPYRGIEENEPIFTRYVLQKIQELRNENLEEIEKQIFENSINFFKIKQKRGV